MDKIIAFLNAVTPFLVAVTALLVFFQGLKIHKIQKQTNGMQGAMMKLAKREGAQEESAAQSKGQTTVEPSASRSLD